jgi:hypothetical protein
LVEAAGVDFPVVLERIGFQQRISAVILFQPVCERRGQALCLLPSDHYEPGNEQLAVLIAFRLGVAQLHLSDERELLLVGVAPELSISNNPL